MSDSAEMPKYKSHKIVHALKLKQVDPDGKMHPEDARYAPFYGEPGYNDKHKPYAGGYYVVYPDGYKSFSPAKAFEDGYSPA